MRRIYTVVFDKVAVAAQQDFFELVCAAGVPVEIHEVTIDQDASITSEMLSLRFTRGHTVSGSGGSVPTPRMIAPGDPASVTTVEVNNTTKANTSGLTLLSAAFNVLNGYHYLPTPEDRIVVGGGQRFVVELTKIPAASLTMSGTITFGEVA